MSSGEADAYTLTVNGYTPTVTSTPYYWNYSFSSPHTVYYYQIRCPRCQKMNWAELDKIIECRGEYKRRECGASLKAVNESVDFEVPIEK